MSSSYCSSCKIELQNDDNIRDHYKSEFHRYNIKRKLVNLPPVTDDQFSKKKARITLNSSLKKVTLQIELIAESSQSEKDVLYKCELCSKSFASKATYKQHLESNKHRENLKKFNKGGAVGADIPIFREQQEGTQKTALEDQTVCLFCNQKNPDLNENLLHMRLAHSFFISEFNHLKNLKGLLKHLAFKIHKKQKCFYCPEDCKTAEGVQQHMIDKGHVFMNTEDFGEYLTFYDFSKKIENLRQHGLLVEEDEAVPSNVDLLEIVLENRDEEEREDSDEEDGVEEDNQSWEVIDGPEGPETRKVYRMRAAKLLPTGEIQLPNGTILGHRKLKTAYKQYYRDLARQSEVNQGELEYVSENVLAARQEENRLAALKETAERRQRNFVESQAHQLFIRREREDLRLKMRTNHMQHHFRKQDNQ